MVKTSILGVVAARDAVSEGTAQDSARESPAGEEEEEIDGYIKKSPLLYQLIIGNSWEAVIKRCKSHPAESKQWLVRENEKSWCRLPLHEACVRGASAEVIDALLEANPDAAKSPDHSSRLPLHHACFYGCSTGVVKKLICAYTEGISKKDIYNKSPMTIAESSSSKNKNEIINILLRDPLIILVEEYRSKWEQEQELLLSDLRSGFDKERSKYEMKIRSLSSQMKEQWNKYEEEIRATMNGNKHKVELLLKDHRADKNKIMSEHNLSLERQRELYEERIAALEKVRNDTKERLENAENNISLLTESLYEKRASEDRLNIQVGVLKKMLDEQTLKCNELTRINSNLHAEFAKSNIEASSVINQLSVKLERENALAADIKKLKVELIAEKMVTKKLQGVIETCRTENKSLVEQVNAYRENLAEMQLRAHFYKSKAYESTLGTMKKVREDNANLSSQADELRQRLAVKEAELKLATQKLEDASKKHDIINNEFQEQLQGVKNSREKLTESHETEKQNLIFNVINLTSQLEDLTAKDDSLKEMEECS
jgi:hypothetical protein